MCNPASEVSAHLHIARNGEVVQLVPFNKRAYHAGISSFQGKTNFNWFSIGIELQNTGKEEYTEIQLEELKKVCISLIKTYTNILDILGHKDISAGRKVDPNPFFPMEKFKKEILTILNR